VSFYAYSPAVSCSLIYNSNIAFKDVAVIATSNCTHCRKFNFIDIRVQINAGQGLPINITLNIQGFVEYDANRKAIIVSFHSSIELKTE